MASQDQLNEVQKQLKLDRTKDWRDAGFTGEIVPIVICETKTSTHAAGSLQRIKEISGTDKNVLFASISGEEELLNYGFVVNGTKVFADEYLSKNKIGVITRSISGKASSGTPVSDFWNTLTEKYNLYPVNSGGNDDESYLVNSAFPLDVASQCSACTTNGYQTYSSEGIKDTDIDFCEFVGYQQGTSFGSPGHAQKARMVKHRFGLDMSYDEVFQFFVMCSSKTVVKLPDNPKLIGYGLPVLPELSKKYIQLDIGNQKYRVNGIIQEKFLDSPPIIIDGYTFVPIRAIAEMFGARTLWDPTTRCVTIIKGDKVVKLWIGQNIAAVNNLKTDLPVAPFISNNRTMVPLKVISVGLGCGCKWIAKRKRVTILEK